MFKTSLFNTSRVHPTASLLKHNFSVSVSSSQSNKCDVAIIGGGIMGLNIAYQLNRRLNNASIKIFEKYQSLGHGSTGASSANLRTIYSKDEMVKFARDGINSYINWNDYIKLTKDETSAKYTKTGILYMMEDTRQNIQNTIDKFKTMDIKLSMVDKAMMESLYPMINSDIGYFDNNGIVEYTPKPMTNDTVFLYEDDGGYFEPMNALNDLYYAIKTYHNQNIQILFNNKVENIVQSNGNCNGVMVRNTKDNHMSTIYANTVINCNGPWYNQIINNVLDGLDIELTLNPVRIQVIYKNLESIFPDNSIPFPMIADLFSGVYMVPQIQRKQLLISSLKEEDENDICNPDNTPLDLGCDPEYRNAYLNSLYHRLSNIINPSMGSKIQSISGMYTICKDDVHPIIGQTKLKNFWVCNGFSGHGFKCAPAVGSIIARNVTGIKIEEDTNVPIQFYSPYREPHHLKVKSVMA